MVLPVYNPIKGTSRITIIYKKWGKFFSNAWICWVSHTCICMCPALSKSTNLLNCIINSNCASYWFVLNFSVLMSRVLTLAGWWNMSLILAEAGISRLRPAWSIEEGQGSEKPCLEKQKQPTKQKTPKNQN